MGELPVRDRLRTWAERFVAFTLVAGQGLSYPEAMGVIVVEGLLITLLVLTGFRVAVLNAIPMDLKRAIAIGIGLS